MIQVLLKSTYSLTQTLKAVKVRTPYLAVQNYPHIYVAGISEIWTQTSTRKDADTDDAVTIQVCQMSANCCTSVLDDPDKNDHELGALGKYSNSLLGECENTYGQGQLAVTLEKDGSNGWYVDWVRILLDKGSSYTCSFDLMLDNDHDNGYYETITLNCDQGKYMLVLHFPFSFIAPGHF